MIVMQAHRSTKMKVLLTLTIFALRICRSFLLSSAWIGKSEYAGKAIFGSSTNNENNLSDVEQLGPFMLTGIDECQGDDCYLSYFLSNMTSTPSYFGRNYYPVQVDWPNGINRILLLTKPDPAVWPAFEQALQFLSNKGKQLFVEPDAFKYIANMNDSAFRVMSENEDKLVLLGEVTKGTVQKFDIDAGRAIDLIITFGGDGLLMHCNSLFDGSEYGMPPTMCFDFGSLGFLAPFSFENFEEEFARVSYGKSVPITLRMRLQCSIWKEDKCIGVYHVLNEAVVDRGVSPFLSVLDIDCDNQYLTTLQGDGIIFSTPTGSTAYSLAAGGSMVHPSVPAILLTPICAHTLSFRPLLLPDSSRLTCTVPSDSRASAWVSFDGKFRQELSKGDRLEIQASKFPVPTINRLNFTGDWFQALRSGFMFNLRPRQKGGLVKGSEAGPSIS